jgi:hypothetical protein
LADYPVRDRPNGQDQGYHLKHSAACCGKRHHKKILLPPTPMFRRPAASIICVVWISTASGFRSKIIRQDGVSAADVIYLEAVMQAFQQSTTPQATSQIQSNRNILRRGRELLTGLL